MKNIISLLILAIAFTACNNTPDPFLISKQNIGLLTDSTQVKDLESVFTNDSIVSFKGGDEFTGNINAIDIYEKGGKHLLSLSPSEALDSTATIKTIKVIDPRYKTNKGVNTASTFGDIKTKHDIKNIQNTVTNAVVFIKESNAFFTIDKKELPSELRFDTSKKIEAVQIPDTAKIKYFMVGW